MKKRGIALITTIMILLVLTLLSTGLMFTIKNETAISIYQANNVKTVQVAEAALDEVKHRMMLSPDSSLFIGDTSNPLDPDWTTYIIFGTPPTDTGSVQFRQSLQAQITGFDPDNPELEYTTKDVDTEYSLKIRHKTNAAGDKIYFFDSQSQRQFLGDPALIEQYPAVEIVEITAKSNNSTKKIIAEISKQEVNVQVYSALSSATLTWRMTGNTDVYVCGHNHLISTPYNVCPFAPGTTPPLQPGSSSSGGGPPTSAVSCWTEDTTITDTVPLYHVKTVYDSIEHPTKNHWYYNIYTSTFNTNRIEYDEYCSDVGCVAGVATTSSGVGTYGATKQHMFGNPDIIVRQELNIGEIWEILGLNSEAELDEVAAEYGGWKTSIVNAANDDDISFFKFPDGQQLPFNSEIHSRGIIWIQGDCYIKAGSRSFFHKGLIYVQGDLRESAAGGNFDFWILGAMVIKGDIDEIHTSGNKRMFFMYCKDALSKSIESSASFYKILGWKESN